MLGSALGGGARFYLSGLAAEQIGEVFPVGTLVVNVTGSFVIGFVATLTGPDGRVFVGSDARYSSWPESAAGTRLFLPSACRRSLWRATGEKLLAGANIVLSVVLCLLAVWAGHVAASCAQSA